MFFYENCAISRFSRIGSNWCIVFSDATRCKEKEDYVAKRMQFVASRFT